MPKYDGSIRIKTEIDSKSVNVQLSSLENRITKTSDKIASLRSKMDSLKDAKIPTQEYSEISAQIEKAEQKFNKLLEKQEQMQREGRDNGVAWKRLNDQMDEVGNEIRFAKGELQDLVDTGKAFTLGSDTEEFSKLSQQLQYAENDLSVLNDKHEVLELKQEKAAKGYERLGSVAKKAFDSIGNMLKKANSLVDKLGKRFIKIFTGFDKKASEANKSFLGLSTSFKNMLKCGFGISSLYVLINKMRSAIADGFENLLGYSSTLKNSIDNIKASALTLKNAFAAAFSPFVEIALPYVQKLLDYMVQLVNIAGQFFAAITGRKTYIRAIKQTTDALKEETKEMNKQLSPLDKLNNLSSGNSSGADAGSGGTMFEEVPIESDILNVAERIKDILSKLFDPLKKAWNKVGKKVIKAWKYALDEVWKLIKDIGRDFLEVWNQEETIKVFENILLILADIGLVIGNLASQFRKAWNENDVGLHILENIRDIISIIIQHIKNAADATVEWAANLDFYPLLDAFNTFLESLKPVVDNLSGILEDFYTQVLLPLGKWTIEKGLPELLQVFADFNDKVDWESLRANLSEFWQHLEPFAETVGEGLILFIDKVNTALADFLNSQEFKDFLTSVEQWMDNVEPEDVADALENIAKGLIALKLAVIGFGAVKGISEILLLFKALKFLSTGGAAGKAGTTISNLATAMSGLATSVSGAITSLGGISGLLTTDLATVFGAGTFAEIGVVAGTALIGGIAAAIGGWHIGSWIAEKLDLAPKPFKETMQDIKESFTDGSWKGALDLWGEDIKEAFRLVGEFIKEDWNNSYMGQIISSFTDGSWRGALDLWGEDIKLSVQSVGEFIRDDWNNSYIGQMINSFKDGSWKEALSLWKEDIVNAFVTLKERTIEKFNEIKTKILTKLSEIKTKWVETWNGFKEKVTTVFGNIKTSIGSIFEWIKNKIDWIKEKISGIGNTIGGLFSGGKSRTTTFSISHMMEPVSPVVAALSNVEIPAYATGQVIPRTMKQHLAWMGDNNQETEVVSPLSTIEQAVENAINKIGGLGGGDINLNLTVECEGYQLLNIIQKLDREFYKQNSRHAFS